MLERIKRGLNWLSVDLGGSKGQRKPFIAKARRAQALEALDQRATQERLNAVLSFKRFIWFAGATVLIIAIIFATYVGISLLTRLVSFSTNAGSDLAIYIVGAAILTIAIFFSNKSRNRADAIVSEITRLLASGNLSRDSISRSVRDLLVELKTSTEEARTIHAWTRFVGVVGIALSMLAIVTAILGHTISDAEEDSTNSNTLLVLPGPVLPANMQTSVTTGHAIFVVYFNKDEREVDDQSAEQLSRLYSRLEHCARANAPVDIEVMGFASTLEYQDSRRNRAQSDAYNKLLAEDRASNTAAMITESKPEEQFFVVTAKKWNSYAHMTNNLTLIDRPANEKGETGLEFFNQIAVVYLKSSGICAPPNVR